MLTAFPLFYVPNDVPKTVIKLPPRIEPKEGSIFWIAGATLKLYNVPVNGSSVTEEPWDWAIPSRSRMTLTVRFAAPNGCPLTMHLPWCQSLVFNKFPSESVFRHIKPLIEIFNFVSSSSSVEGERRGDRRSSWGPCWV